MLYFAMKTEQDAEAAVGASFPSASVGVGLSGKATSARFSTQRLQSRVTAGWREDANNVMNSFVRRPFPWAPRLG